MKIRLLFLCFVFLCVHLLQAQDLVLPPKVNLLQYTIPRTSLTDLPDIRIWGWSQNGRVAYSTEWQEPFRGGQVIDFIIIDLIADNNVFELRMDSYEHNGIEDDALYNLYRNVIQNAMRTNNIIDHKPEFQRFPLRRNNIVFDSHIIDIKYRKNEERFMDFISEYTVLVTADDRRKIINEVTLPDALMNVSVAGYFLSPFENRILVVIAEEWFLHGGGVQLIYRFNGCHLGVGFN